MPYTELSNEEVRTEVKKGLRLPRPDKIAIPETMWNLIQSCWHSSPQQRPTFDSIFAHLCAIEKELDLASSSDEEEDQHPKEDGKTGAYVDDDAPTQQTEPTRVINNSSDAQTARYYDSASNYKYDDVQEE